jgi:hypothetical protein
MCFNLHNTLKNNIFAPNKKNEYGKASIYSITDVEKPPHNAAQTADFGGRKADRQDVVGS